MKRKIKLIAAATWSGSQILYVVTEDEKIFYIDAKFDNTQWKELPKIPDTE